MSEIVASVSLTGLALAFIVLSRITPEEAKRHHDKESHRDV